MKFFITLLKDTGHTIVRKSTSYNTIEFWDRFLVENAIRYSKKGGKIIISLSQSIQTNNPGLIDNNKTQKDNEIFIQVRDTGKGISPEILPHIFSKFVSDP